MIEPRYPEDLYQMLINIAKERGYTESEILAFLSISVTKRMVELDFNENALNVVFYLMRENFRKQKKIFNIKS